MSEVDPPSEISALGGAWAGGTPAVPVKSLSGQAKVTTKEGQKTKA